MIEIFDNFLDDYVHKNIWTYCNEVSYKVGEKDRDNTIPTGGVFEIIHQDSLFSLLDNSLKQKINHLRNLNCYRAYINCFFPNENPYFHRDNNKGYTCLYYPNINFDLDEGGETQFFIDNEIKGILPIPNRMVFFDARLQHKATAFRNQHRFTIAIKYQ